MVTWVTTALPPGPEPAVVPLRHDHAVQLLSGVTGGPVAVLLPGTASTGEFVARAFGPALRALGIGVVSGDPPGDVAARYAELADAVARFRPVLIGGVSVGAHVAARWAATSAYRPDGLLLAMPAWTGAPGPVAAASAVAAAEVERDGVAAALARIQAGAAPASAWVAGELAAAWPSYRGPALAAALRASAASRGPSPAELAAVAVPCGLVLLRDDLLHPASVGRAWAAALPRAAVVETGLAAVGADRATLGRGAVLAWLRARGPIAPGTAGAGADRASGPR